MLFIAGCCHLLYELSALQEDYHDVYSFLLPELLHFSAQRPQLGKGTFDVFVLETFYDLFFYLEVLTDCELMVVLIADVELGSRQLANRQNEGELSIEKKTPRFLGEFTTDFVIKTVAEMGQTSALCLKGWTHTKKQG